MRLFFLACLLAPFAFARADKKLIEFGWDQPNTAFMRAHVAEMEQTPFDGCVFYVNYLIDGKATGSFLGESWGVRSFTEAQLQPAIEDLKATAFNRFTENFLRFDVTPGNVDWFDDFSAIENNARLAARVAKEGGCRGILFDDEAYNFLLFNYTKQRDAKTKTWEDYCRQARQRGREVMRGFQQGYPGVTIMITLGYTYPLAQTRGDRSKLRDVKYGLLPAFLDGMTEEAKADTKLIDGFELSYAYRTAADFAKGRQAFASKSMAFIANPALYSARFKLGFGLWMDNDWRKLGWNTDEASKNYFTPEKFEAAARLALEASDRYVWIYTEKPSWWTAAGKPENLPAAYSDALRRARQSVDR